MFSSLRARLFIINLGLIILGFGSLTLWAGRQMAQATWDDYGNNQQIVGLVLANQVLDPLEDNEMDQVVQILQQSADNLNAQITLFDTQANAQYSTGKTMIFAGDSNYTVQAGQVQSASEIVYESDLLGYVQIGTNATVPQSAVRQRWLELGAAFLAFSLLGILITLWLLNTLTKPLASLRNSALKIAAGELDHRTADLPNNEIGAVGTAFNNMADRITALINEQRAFASNASHELRTPLTTIRLRTEALRRGLDAPTQAQYIEEIDTESLRLSQLVDDLLLISRLDAKRMESGKEQLDLSRILRWLETEQATLADEKNITLTVVKPQQPVTMSATLTHIQIVLRNIVNNAIKYTPEQGAVHVVASVVDNTVRFKVSDNGRGIAPENLPNIGKRFYRTDKARNRKTSGVGLGLSLVAQILDLYEGNFTVESKGEGQGTTVLVHWPLGNK